MSKRPPNEIESKLHQAALSAPKNELTTKQVESLVPDAGARQKALNFLLGVGLFKSLADKKGNLTFRAVTKNELIATKDLSGEENLVLSHIKASHNEGIWTKHLKTKTNLHQTVIDRCLKTLVQKKLIKRVPSVQHQTRKIYMLEGLEPSIALTGGPWYTDNELDTEFIETLIKACFKFIRDSSFPKRRQAEGALYPISNAPSYPSAQQVRNALRQARLTETDLSVEHVEMLLNVLVLDGEVEKIPAFGTTLWDSSAIDNDQSDDEADRSTKKKKKRKRDSSDDEAAEGSSKRKRKKKKAASDSDSESDDTSSRKKSKRKKARDGSDSDSESDSKSSKKKKKKKKQESDDEKSDSDDDAKTSRKRRKRHASRSSSDSESSASDSDGGKSRRRSKSSKRVKRSESPMQTFSFEDLDEGGAHVYKAIKQERLELGWSQAPCSNCPSFEFCKHGGPVNPRECVYYGDWLEGGTVAEIEDIA